MRCYYVFTSCNQCSLWGFWIYLGKFRRVCASRVSWDNPWNTWGYSWSNAPFHLDIFYCTFKFCVLFLWLWAPCIFFLRSLPNIQVSESNGDTQQMFNSRSDVSLLRECPCRKGAATSCSWMCHLLAQAPALIYRTSLWETTFNTRQNHYFVSYPLLWVVMALLGVVKKIQKTYRDWKWTVKPSVVSKDSRSFIVHWGFKISDFPIRLRRLDFFLKWW